MSKFEMVKNFVITYVHFGPSPGSICLVPGILYTRFSLYDWLSFKAQSAFLYLQEYVGMRYRDFYQGAEQ
jgi:hypothetical protein